MIERNYNVPLRVGFRNTAKYKKTKKAITTLKEFLSRHMKSNKILIGKNLNQYLWKNGIKNPPHHVKVTAIKEDNGTVKVELFGFKYEHMKKTEKELAKEKKEKNSSKENNEKLENVLTDKEDKNTKENKEVNEVLKNNINQLPDEAQESTKQKISKKTNNAKKNSKKE